jgi:hypothetical protein
MKKETPRCTIHGSRLDRGYCWACKNEADEREERRLAGLTREHYRATAPAEMAIGVADGGKVQRFRIPKMRRRR